MATRSIRCGTSCKAVDNEGAGNLTAAAFHWPRYPYPGLRPFQVTAEADESLIFKGRDQHKDEIIGRLGKSHLVMVIGPSGCGKSSLIKAGVIPAMEAGFLARAGERWRTCQMRPGRRPLAELARALAGIAAPAASPERDAAAMELEQLLRDGPSGLWLATGRLRDGGALGGTDRGTERLLVLLDQFEELFGPQIEDKKDVDDFVRLLVRFFEKPHDDLYIVITMRTGYIGDAANFVGLAELLNATMYLTPVLDSEELREAITLPAEDYQGEVEPVLVDALLADMGTGTQYDADHLPLLQHALLWLWLQAWPRGGASEPPSFESEPLPEPVRLMLADYRAFGGFKGILERHAEDVLAAAVGREPERLGRIVEIIFRRLTERDYGGRYRRTPATMAELGRLAACDQAVLTEILAPFADPGTSLLEFRPSTSGPETMVDVSHESLIRQWPRLRAWTEDEAQQRRHFQGLLRRAKTWARSGAGGRNILLEDDLGWAQRWLQSVAIYDTSQDSAAAWSEHLLQGQDLAWAAPFGGPVGAIRALSVRSEQARDARQQEEQRRVEEAARQEELEARLKAEAERALSDREASRAQAALNEAKAQQAAAELSQQRAQSTAKLSQYAMYGSLALAVLLVLLGWMLWDNQKKQKAQELAQQQQSLAEQAALYQQQLTRLADLYAVAVANRDLPLGILPSIRRDAVFQELAVLMGSVDDSLRSARTDEQSQRLRVLEGEIDRVARQTMTRTLAVEPVLARGAHVPWQGVVRECVLRAQAGVRREVVGVSEAPIGGLLGNSVGDATAFAMLSRLDNRATLEMINFEIAPPFRGKFDTLPDRRNCWIDSERALVEVASLDNVELSPSARWLVERPAKLGDGGPQTVKVQWLDWFQICLDPSQPAVCPERYRQWHVEQANLGDFLGFDQPGRFPAIPARMPALAPRFQSAASAAGLMVQFERPADPSGKLSVTEPVHFEEQNSWGDMLQWGGSVALSSDATPGFRISAFASSDDLVAFVASADAPTAQLPADTSLPRACRGRELCTHVIRVVRLDHVDRPTASLSRIPIVDVRFVGPPIERIAFGDGASGGDLLIRFAGSGNIATVTWDRRVLKKWICTERILKAEAVPDSYFTAAFLNFKRSAYDNKSTSEDRLSQACSGI